MALLGFYFSTLLQVKVLPLWKDRSPFFLQGKMSEPGGSAAGVRISDLPLCDTPTLGSEYSLGEAGVPSLLSLLPQV